MSINILNRSGEATVFLKQRYPSLLGYHGRCAADVVAPCVGLLHYEHANRQTDRTKQRKAWWHMQTRDYHFVGLKLICVCYGVFGITILSVALINFIIQGIMPYFEREGVLYAYEGATIGLITAMQPIAYLACAFALTRKTDWCLSLIECQAPESQTADAADTPSFRQGD